MKVTVEHSAQMAAMREAGIKLPKIVEKFKELYSRASIYRHANIPLGQPSRSDRRRENKGRPRKLTERDERRVIRSIDKLREEEGSFTSKRIASHAGLATARICNRTIRRCLNRHGYGYRQSRKKGLMTLKDRVKRVKFCRDVKSLKCGVLNFWKKYISMYVDGVGFEFKTRPLDQARAPSAREWRLKSEGLKVTMKGRKEGVRNANFMVGVCYRKGVIAVKQYFGQITGAKYAKITEQCLAPALEKSIQPRARRILQDGCPRQNSKEALAAMANNAIKIFKIPPRSPDLNPIENFFNTMKKRLRQQALDEKIERETFEEFSERVKRMLLDFPAEDIDKIIDSMGKRVDDIIRSGGYRTKY